MASRINLTFINRLTVLFLILCHELPGAPKKSFPYHETDMKYWFLSGKQDDPKQGFRISAVSNGKNRGLRDSNKQRETS